MRHHTGLRRKNPYLPLLPIAGADVGWIVGGAEAGVVEVKGAAAPRPVLRQSR